MIILFSLIVPERISAKLSDISPDVACGLLTSIGLTTQGWQHYYNDSFGCNSRPMQFGSPKPFYNSLSYSVEGSSGTVKELILILSVNNIDEAAGAHQLILQAAQKLLIAVRNQPMPDNMVNAILHGENYSLITDSINVTIKISYWMIKSKKLDSAISKGYELRLIID
jgi:hypothetical protein